MAFDRLRDLIARIRVVADKRSADTAEKEVSGSLNRIGDVAKKIGGFLAAAFAVQKIIAFGRSAVQAAMEAETAWSNLANTLRNVGVAWEDAEAKYRAAAAAFQDATVYDDDDFAKGVQRLTILTGDHAAALQNMGLVANVAALYFEGNLEPAIELVGRALTGQTRALRQLGIVTDDANEALRILAERTMGGAAQFANTFTGQVMALNVAWGNFKEAIGDAIIAGGQGVSVMSTLTAAIRTMTEWLVINKDTLAAWVSGGLNAAITVAKGFKLALEEIGDALTILTVGPWAVATKAAAMLARGYALVVSAGAPFSATLRRHRDEIRALADELERAADEFFKYASSDDPRKFLIRNRKPGDTTATPGKGIMPGGGIGLPAEEAAQDVADANVEAAATARTAWDEFFDAVGQGFDQAGEAANGFAAGLVSGVIGGLKAVAQFKMKEQLAEGVSKLAAGIWPPNPAALASSAKHFAAAGLWAGIASLAGSGARGVAGGGGGVGLSGPTDFGGSRADNTKVGNHIVVYVDGFDKNNLAHVRILGEGMKEVSRDDSSIDIRPRSGAR